MGRMGGSSYASAGVDTTAAESAVAGLVAVLRTIDPGRESRAVLGSGHYANVLRLDDRTGIALSTDGVGTKVIVAEQLGRFDTVGIDCIAMNVNDVICVGVELIAQRSRAEEPELLEVFNMGCGFCCVVPGDQTDVAVEVLDSHHPGSAV